MSQTMVIYRLGIGILLCAVMSAAPAFSQSDAWRSVPVPDTIVAKCLTTDSHGDIFVGTSGGIYRSTNGGLDWTSIVATFPGYSGKCDAILRASDDAIWAANGLRICKTTDEGDHWQVVQHPVTSDFYFAALATGEHYGIFLSAAFPWSNSSENFRSTDGGSTWSRISLDGYMPSTFVEHNDFILTSGYWGSGSRSVAGHHAVVLSTDGGSTWNEILGHFEQYFPALAIDQRNTFYLSKTDWSAGKGGVFWSTTFGASWQSQDCGRGTATVQCLAVSPDSQVFAGSQTGVYRIQVGPAVDPWTPADEGITDSNVVSFHMSPTGYLYALTNAGHLYAIRPELMSRPPSVACYPPASPVLVSPPDGTHFGAGASVQFRWRAVAGAETYKATLTFDEHPGYINYFTTADTTYTDWVSPYPGSLSSSRQWYVEARNSAGYGQRSLARSFVVGSVPWSAPVLVSPANGSYFLLPISLKFTWHPVPGADSYMLITSVGAQGTPTSVTVADTSCTRTFSAPADVVWYVQGVNSSGPGPSSINWNFAVRPFYPPPQPVYPADSAFNTPLDILFQWNRSIAPVGYRLEVATSSLFDEANFRSFSGLTDTAYLVKGLQSATRYWWRVAPEYSFTEFSWSPVNMFTTSVNASVKQISPSAPEAASISQNFPNPFNSTTTFEFGIPEDGNVELTIYSLSGALVGHVVNNHIPAGTFRVEWQPGSIASGVYLYQFKGGGRVLNGKLLYLK